MHTSYVGSFLCYAVLILAVSHSHILTSVVPNCFYRMLQKSSLLLHRQQKKEEAQNACISIASAVFGPKDKDWTEEDGLRDAIKVGDTSLFVENDSRFLLELAGVLPFYFVYSQQLFAHGILPKG